MNRRDIPNIISVLRILLVFPVVWALLEGRFTTALILFFIAGVSDALDGFLAKHNGWESRLGSILDPIGDKVLLVSSFMTLAWLGLIPVWLFLVVIGRDVLIVVGALTYHFLIGEYEMEPSLFSKVNTFFQIVFVLAMVFYHGDFAVAPWLITTLGYIVVATTVISGIDYVWVWGTRSIREKKS